MFAVFSNKSIVYLGNDRAKAMEILESKSGSTLNNASTLANLASAFESYLASNPESTPSNEDDFTEDLSDAISKLFERLDEAGLNSDNATEVANKLKKDGKRALTEVKSLGIKSMNAVGESFVALGEMLSEFTDEDEK